MTNKPMLSVPRELIEQAMLACFEVGFGITHDKLRDLLDKPVVESEFEPDAVCTESDGCPTEGAVLKRFWRENQPDTELCKFYEAEDYQSLVKELVGHVAQLEAANRVLRIVAATLPHLEAKNTDSVRQLIKDINGVIGSPKEANENA